MLHSLVISKCVMVWELGRSLSAHNLLAHLHGGGMNRGATDPMGVVDSTITQMASPVHKGINHSAHWTTK